MIAPFNQLVTGNSNVSVRDLTTLSQVGTLAPYTNLPTNQVGGTRVGFTRNDAGDWEILTGSGPGFPAQTQFWNSTTMTEFGGVLTGVFVG